MRLTYDPVKSTRNEHERGMPFGLAAEFDWNTALIVEDQRQDYQEKRFQALGYIQAHLCMLVFTP